MKKERHHKMNLKVFHLLLVSVIRFLERVQTPQEVKRYSAQSLKNPWMIHTLFEVADTHFREMLSSNVSDKGMNVLFVEIPAMKMTLSQTIL